MDVDFWSLRNDYIEVILNRNSDCVESFISRHVREDLPEEEKIRLLKLLEMQYNALLMYTSCGWFFDDIGGIEGVQIMKYAARAIQLAKEVSGQDFEEQFVQFLEKAQSNVPECKNGGHVYRTTVQPSVVDLLRVGAHYAVTSLYEEYPERVKMYAYTVQTDRYDLKAAGRLRLAIGKGWVRSDITFEKHFINFVVLHLGDHNFIGGVDYLKSEENFALMHRKILNAFLGSNILEVISLINQYFGTRNYSLWHLFKHEQQKILNMVLQSTMQEIESSFRQIYEHHYPLMQIKNEIQLPLPRTLTTVVEFVLNQDLFEALESEEINVERLQTLIEEIKRWSFKRDQANFNFIASQKISDMMVRFSHQPDNIGLMEKIELILKTLTHLNLELDLWKAQNIFFSIKKTMYAEKKVKSERDELARRWLVAFNNLAQFLQIAIR